jgi:hypothetical protein
MEQINLGKSYGQVLASLSPTQVMSDPIPGTFQLAQPFTVPPLNTDIRFSSFLQPKHYSDSQYLSVATTPLPEQWDWRNDYDIDDAIVKKKKKNLTAVPNQGMCGSCWAVGAAGLVGDLFVTMGLVDKNPGISTTYSLSCYPQLRCGGGNPAELLKQIEQSGVSTERCLTYEWCSGDPGCSGKGTQHFNAGNETQRLNKLIPQCGCPGNQELYYVKDSAVVAMENDDHDISGIIKNHIFRVGPVLGGYHVLKNFMSGNYQATAGVYMEGYDYENDKWYDRGDEAKWTGSHALVVLGWGLSPLINIPLPDGRANPTRVPYWYCRNSWGADWGLDSGYFRIAMYPYNKRSQFERLVVIKPENALSGGFVICSPDKMTLTDNLGRVLRARIARESYDDVIEESGAYTWVLIAALLAIVVGIMFYVARGTRR